MTSKQNKHQKHGKTVKAEFGAFGRLEIAIMGTPCGNIKQLANELIDKLGQYRLAYADADHSASEDEISRFMKAGSEAVYTNKIEFHRLDMLNEPNKYQRNALFNEYDLVIINGNHFTGNTQLLVIDDKKPLKKKLDKITNPVAIAFVNEDHQIPDYLHDHFAGIDELPKFSISNSTEISAFLENHIKSKRAVLNGLVLAGGKSTRMQQDKSRLEYHGLPQRTHVFNMLNNICQSTYYSCRKDQIHEFDSDTPVITDSIDDLGPYGAILSAFRRFPDNAWLVAACDLPLLKPSTIQFLAQHRNSSKIATAFYNSATAFPEPLITIWEPKAYSVMLHFLGLGYSCPRKVLINSNIEIIQAPDVDDLMNVNNPDEYKAVKSKLANME